jgi:hypothetical protein
VIETDYFIPGQYSAVQPYMVAHVLPETHNQSSVVNSQTRLTWYVPRVNWHLAPGTWHLAPGTWHLAPGTWHLARRDVAAAIHRAHAERHLAWYVSRVTWHVAPST